MTKLEKIASIGGMATLLFGSAITTWLLYLLWTAGFSIITSICWTVILLSLIVITICILEEKEEQIKLTNKKPGPFGSQEIFPNAK
jgi:uncharacterized membrane protein